MIQAGLLLPYVSWSRIGGWRGFPLYCSGFGLTLLGSGICLMVLPPALWAALSDLGASLQLED